MADYLRAALDTYATSSHRVVLFLDSAGGQVEEGDRIIHVLDEIKQTHRLITDKVFASMRIPVFLQVNHRPAAPNEPLDLPRGRQAGRERQGANGGDVARVRQILRSGWRLPGLAQKDRAYHQTSGLLGIRRQSRQREDRYRRVSAGEMDRAGRGSMGRPGETRRG